MAKQLMKAGKFLDPAGTWKEDRDQIVMLREVRKGDEFEVMDDTGTITWGIVMERTDGGGVDGDKIDPADLKPFG